MNFRKKMVVTCGSLVVLVMALMPLQAETPKIGVTLTGGMTYIAGGDLNTYVDSLKQSFTLIAKEFDATTKGEFKKMHTGFDLAGAVTIDFNKSFGLSLGSGWIQAAKGADTNVMTVSYAGEAMGSLTLDMTVRAIPVSLNAIYRLPVSDKISFTLSGGASYYFADFNHSIAVNLMSEVDSTDVKSSGHGLGVQAAAGLELALGKNIFLLANVEGRMAKISSFKGDVSQNGKVVSTGNTAYYYEQDGLGAIEFAKTKPTDPTYKNVRESKLDLSGVALRVGIKIAL